MHHDDTAVLLLVYIVSWATVVSLVVWERMKGAMGVMGVCMCVGGVGGGGWRVEGAVTAAGVRKCVPCLLTLEI